MTLNSEPDNEAEYPPLEVHGTAETADPYPEADPAQMLAEFDTWFKAYVESPTGLAKPLDDDAWQTLFDAVGSFYRTRALDSWQAAWMRAWGLAARIGYEAGRLDAYDNIAKAAPAHSGPRYLGTEDSRRTEHLLDPGSRISDEPFIVEEPRGY